MTAKTIDTTASVEHSDGVRQRDRRRFLKLCTGIATGLVISPAFARPHEAGERTLALYNTHTGERVKATYWADGGYLDDGLQDLAHLLRDHRTGEVHAMDPQLLELLHRLHGQFTTRQSFHVISGYRSPKTNEMLRGKSGGVAKRSMHMQGKAIDIRLPKVELKQLRAAALSLKSGGVGYYARSNFIHLDTGRVRFW